jgi:hypothetical protein
MWQIHNAMQLSHSMHSILTFYLPRGRRNNAYFINSGVLKLSAIAANKTICLLHKVSLYEEFVTEDRFQHWLRKSKLIYLFCNDS